MCRDLWYACGYVCERKTSGWEHSSKARPSLPVLQFPGMQQTALLIHVQNLCHDGKRNENHKCQSVSPPPCQNKPTTEKKKKLLKIKRHIEFYLIRINTMIPNIPYTWHSQSLKFQYKKIMITFAGKSLRRHFID